MAPSTVPSFFVQQVPQVINPTSWQGGPARPAWDYDFTHGGLFPHRHLSHGPDPAAMVRRPQGNRVEREGESLLRATEDMYNALGELAVYLSNHILLLASSFDTGATCSLRGCSQLIALVERAIDLMQVATVYFAQVAKSAQRITPLLPVHQNASACVPDQRPLCKPWWTDCL